MDKILLIIDGILARHFLEKLCLQKAKDYSFVVLYYNDESINEKLANDEVSFIKFDPTSASKLSRLLSENFAQVLVYMQDEFDSKSVYENLRAFSKDLDIVLMDFWGLPIDDNKCELIDVRANLSNNLINFLPNIAKTAQNIGLGTGEIMEVRLPADSLLAYRHLSTISQRKWRISLIYRNSKILFPSPSTMLMPNDNLLLVGNPAILQGLFHNIHQKRGQFPSPFGSNIYAIIDMKKQNLIQMEHFFADMLYLHTKIKSKKLFIRVLNAYPSPFYETLKAFNKNNINIYFDYEQRNFNTALEFIKGNDIGLLCCDKISFENNKKALFELKTPVLTKGQGTLEKIKAAIALSSAKFELEDKANVMIDLSKQLDLAFRIYLYELDTQEKPLQEHFTSLSNLYDTKIEFIKTSKNPIIELENSSVCLQFISFDEELLQSNFILNFSTNFNALYHKMKKNYQLFIPVN